METPAFRNFVKKNCSPTLKVRTRRSYSRLINFRYLQLKNKMLETIKATDFISTTADCWSSRRRAFLGVTAHWLTKDLKRVSVCLALRRITEAHTYDVLAGHLESVHSGFGLVPARNLIETVTDGGSNILKSFKVFGVAPGHPAPATSDSTKTSAKHRKEKTQVEPARFHSNKA